jgi:hypothetical protein
MNACRKPSLIEGMHGAVASALSGSQDGTIRSNELREGVLTG